MSRVDEFPSAEDLGLRYAPQTSNPSATFSLRGNLGRSQRFEYVAGIPSPLNKRVLIEAQSEPGTAIPLNITLFTVSNSLVFGGSPIVPLTITVEFGNGGVQASAEITFEEGLTFTVPGSWIRVFAEPNTAPPAVEGEVLAAAFITNLRIASPPAHLGERVPLAGTVAPAASATATIPRFAREVSVFSLDGQSFDLDFMRAGNTSGQLSITAGKMLESCPIPAAADQVILTNTGAAVQAWQAEWGIFL